MSVDPNAINSKGESEPEENSKLANTGAHHKATIVQKYGGATLSDPAKIKQVAKRLVDLQKSGKRVIAVVSAMGSTTNQLIELAHQVSTNPNRREFDMLLSTGERISMALLSMALQDLQAQAISFTGSQAGILTSDSHLSAHIIDVKCPRIEQALNENKIVVLAGFQGVSPTSKEITTLGRGGSDITAVAVAAAVRATRCEILKDVAGVFSADPKIVPQAQAISRLSHGQLMEMTFWGAKVLHYRSVELAYRQQISLYIGAAAQDLNQNPKLNLRIPGTHVELSAKVGNKKGESMFETQQILSLNAHDLVLQIDCSSGELATALAEFETLLAERELASPQILQSFSGEKSRMLITGPVELLQALQREFQKNPKFSVSPKEFSTIAVTCAGSYNAELPQQISKRLQEQKIFAHALMMSPMSIVALVERAQKDQALRALHELIR